MIPVHDEKPRKGALFASQRHVSFRLGVRVGDLDPTREADPDRERRTGCADAALGRPAGDRDRPDAFAVFMYSGPKRRERRKTKGVGIR